MGRKNVVVIISLIAMSILGVQLASAKQIESSPGIKKNYALNLSIQTEKFKEDVTLVLSGDNFSANQYFSDASLKIEGVLTQSKDGLFNLDYKLWLTEKIVEGSNEGATHWVDNGCSGRVVLTAKTPLIIFKTTGRSYSLEIEEQ